MAPRFLYNNALGLAALATLSAGACMGATNAWAVELDADVSDNANAGSAADIAEACAHNDVSDVSTFEANDTALSVPGASASADAIGSPIGVPVTDSLLATPATNSLSDVPVGVSRTDVVAPRQRVEQPHLSEDASFKTALPASAEFRSVSFTVNNEEPAIDKYRLVEDGIYSINAAYNTSFGLDVAYGRFEEGSRILIYPDNSQFNQRFELRWTQRGWRIAAPGTSQVLSLSGGNTGASVILSEDRNLKSQRWYLHKSQAGYQISSADNGLVLDIAGGYINAGQSIIVWTAHGQANQDFSLLRRDVLASGDYVVAPTIAPDKLISQNNGALALGQDASVIAPAAQISFEVSTSQGYYYFKNKQTGGYLSVSGPYAADGEQLRLRSEKTDNAAWTLIPSASGGFTLRNKASWQVLDVYRALTDASTPLIVWKDGKTENQSFKLISTKLVQGKEDERIVPDGYYTIAAAANTKQVLDVARSSTKPGTNILVWESNNQINQKWKLTWRGGGFYSIEGAQSHLALSASRVGSALTQEQFNAGLNQLWRLKRLANNRVVIISAVGDIALDLPNGKSSSGTKPLSWKLHEALNQQFVLQETSPLQDGNYALYPVAASGVVLDVHPKDSRVQLRKSNPLSNRPITVTNRQDGSVSLRSADGRYLALGPNTGPGASHEISLQSDGGDVRAQWYIIEAPGGYLVKNRATSEVLDIPFARYEEGIFAITYPHNQGQNQIFRIVAAQEQNAFVDTYDVAISLDQMIEYELKANPWISGDRQAKVRAGLDPQGFDRSSSAYLQFVDLRNTENITADTINTFLASSRLGRAGVFAGKGQVFIDAARKHNINAAYLVAHAVLESGWGTSTLARGFYYDDTQGYKNAEGKLIIAPGSYPSGWYHNFFGIGAVDSNPLHGGRAYAVKQGWCGVDGAIEGAAAWISKWYINSRYHQDTLYKMRWNSSAAAQAGYALHEYASDPQWAVKIAQLMGQVYAYTSAPPKLNYLVPRYRS